MVCDTWMVVTVEGRVLGLCGGVANCPSFSLLKIFHYDNSKIKQHNYQLTKGVISADAGQIVF